MSENKIVERELSAEFRKKFMIDLKGKDFIQFDGLMVLAHTDGMQGIKTKIEQFPNDQNGNVAIIHATVTDSKGGTWDGTGDAAPSSVGKTIANAIVRMAETRAIGRALRMMLGIGTMMEEVYNPYEEPLCQQDQLAKMARVMKQRGISKETATDECMQIYGKNTAGNLTKSEADAFIERLRTMDILDEAPVTP